MSGKNQKAIQVEQGSPALDGPEAGRYLTGGPVPGELILPVVHRPGDKVMTNGNGGYISVGKDRDGPIGSGYGNQTDSAAVRMSVGPLGGVGRELASKPEPHYANPSPLYDAGEIYLSQKTNIDERYNMDAFAKRKNIKTGPSRGGSGIGLKADNVRLASRKATKIVAGVDKRDSNNNTIGARYGIQLISNANDSLPNTDLQSMVKGNNLVQALKNMQGRMAELDTQINLLNQAVTGLQTQLLTHFHNATGPGAPTTPVTSPPTYAASIANFVSLGAQVVEIGARQLNHAADETNYLTPGSEGYICSPLNKTT